MDAFFGMIGLLGIIVISIMIGVIFFKNLKAGDQNKTKQKPYLIALGVALVFFFIGMALPSSNPNKETAVNTKVESKEDSTEIKNEDPEDKKNEPTKEPTWEKVIEFTGSSIKDTETFKITSNEWRIDWETSPGQYGDMNFQIYLYKEGSQLPDVSANIIGAGKDVSYKRGSGSYYLTINTAQNYKIIIEEKK
jgi:hypothetical protein